MRAGPQADTARTQTPTRFGEMDTNTGICRIIGLIVPALLVAGSIHAQEQTRIIEQTLPAGRDQKIELNLRFGDTIVVKGWDRQEVSFRATVSINNGKLNDAFLVDYRDDRRGLRIDVDYDKEKIREGRRSDCPDSRHTNSWQHNRSGDGYVVCSRITYEISVPRSAVLRLETISADIEMTGLAGSVEAKSISGFVDLSWPEEVGASLSLKTVSGEAYTDLDTIRFRNRKARPPIVGYELRGTIGTGADGASVRLESVSGDLYLRKG